MFISYALRDIVTIIGLMLESDNLWSEFEVRVLTRQFQDQSTVVSPGVLLGIFAGQQTQ